MRKIIFLAVFLFLISVLDAQNNQDYRSNHKKSNSNKSKIVNKSATVVHSCKWCGGRISGPGFSIYYKEIISGKYKDPIVAEIGTSYYNKLMGTNDKFDNTGDYCSKKCVNEAYYSN